MSALDYAIVIGFFVVTMGVGFWRHKGSDVSAAEFIIGGRRLTMPGFVMSLVSTWYGGILGVGEFTYVNGVSNWLVFGLPYYIAAFIFAAFIAIRAREAEVLTIPDSLENTYGSLSGNFGSVALMVFTTPAAYFLMIGVLCNVIFNVPVWVGIAAGAVFTLVYMLVGGFGSVVRTDIVQFSLMFAGFAVLLAACVLHFGGFEFLRDNLPATHFTWHGGNTGLYIAVWYVIALQTLTEPTFYQRCYAARSPRVAKTGILISIACWTIFDFMTTSTGMYARAALPNLENAVASYPALAVEILPSGLLGFFVASLFATVLSTVDSYLFVGACTYGRDIAWRIFRVQETAIPFHTRVGLILVSVVSFGIAAAFTSIVDMWHHFGSVSTPIFLLPLLNAYVLRRRISDKLTTLSMATSGIVSLAWLLSASLSTDGTYWLGLEPIFPGLLISFLFFAFASKRRV